MSYYILGRDCTPATIALTSNTKFISPLNKIYEADKVKEELVRKYEDEDINFYKKIIDYLITKRVENIKTFDNKCSTC